jgi:hypothetical protein
MLGLNPGPANQAVFGDPKGVYFWVAGCATSERAFHRLIEAEMSRRGLSLDEVSDVMRAEDAYERRRGAEIDWTKLLAAAEPTPSLFIDPTLYFYEEEE